MTPTYKYVCNKCGYTFDAFQQITAGKYRKCPKCGKLALQRQIDKGGGVIFKGEPFSASTEKKHKPNQ